MFQNSSKGYNCNFNNKYVFESLWSTTIYSCFQEFLVLLIILLLQWRKMSQTICPEVTFLKKILFKLASKLLQIFFKFKACSNLIYKARSVCVRLRNSNCFFAFYYLKSAGGFHFQSIFIEIFLNEKFVVSGSC